MANFFCDAFGEAPKAARDGAYAPQGKKSAIAYFGLINAP
jgi:hypothetical protein